jgi:hypothetical protein
MKLKLWLAIEFFYKYFWITIYELELGEFSFSDFPSTAYQVM